jgi:hypothetical protein
MACLLWRKKKATYVRRVKGILEMNVRSQSILFFSQRVNRQVALNANVPMNAQKRVIVPQDRKIFERAYLVQNGVDDSLMGAMYPRKNEPDEACSVIGTQDGFGTRAEFKNRHL